MVGHELTHGFDDEGAQYDKDGNLKNWWTKSAKNGFHEAAQCLVSQYSQYKVSNRSVVYLSVGLHL